MEILEFLQLLQLLCKTHPEIEGFYTGTRDNRDDNSQEYPHCRVIHPFDLEPSSDPRKEELTTMRVQFNIRVRETVKTPISEIEINLNYLTEEGGKNEINTDIALENVLRNNAVRLAFHLVEWLRLSEDDYNFFTVTKALIKGVERAEADNVTGANVYLDMHVGNPHICEARQMFTKLFI